MTLPVLFATTRGAAAGGEAAVQTDDEGLQISDPQAGRPCHGMQRVCKSCCRHGLPSTKRQSSCATEYRCACFYRRH